ncbi:MAG: hypothetical protein ACFFCS_10120 [Candidatus Hodarchaeota archaeon]
MSRNDPKMDFLLKEIDGLKLAASSINAINDGDLDIVGTDSLGKENWCTLVKIAAINRYMKSYLGKLRKYIPGIHLNFVGLVSGPGMHVVSGNSIQAELIVPDPVLLAAYRSSFGNEYHFNSIFTFDPDPRGRKHINKWLESINGKFLDESKYSWYVPSLENDDVSETDGAVLNILLRIKKINNKYVNTFFHVDNSKLNVNLDTLKKIRKLDYVDLIIDFPSSKIQRMFKAALLDKYDPAWEILEKFFGTSLPASKEEIDLASVYKEQLKMIGFNEIEEIRIGSNAGNYSCIFFCTRKPVVELTRITRQYSNISTDMNVTRLKQLLGNSTNSTFNLMDFLENRKGSAPAHEIPEMIQNGMKLLVYKKNEGWGEPLGMPLDETTWKNILSINAFDKLKINGELIIIKKKITKTDLNLKSACVQGKIRQKLNISILDKRPVYLLDRRSNEHSMASFPADGRLDGTAFWLRLYGDQLQHGNFVFLAKLVNQEMVVVVIDHYMQKYPLIKSLRQFHAYCIELKAKNLAFMNLLSD